ncbi:[Ribosomal protein S5]-alanine N-acetyltransferase [Leucobacter soli]|uniref:[Ribosomal protein S5]-alanine N-acetyltransferase n=1 Tax=Leucobacter soli TaxID=2812850 RepID=A0A916JYY9_9MICO|nr:[Ribosomal protein S5]-alanine N-acetyltransferase [Leucobacter soli]
MRPRDASALQQLLTSNRAWLEPWEATYPGGGGAEPGSVPMRPVIRRMLRQQRAGQSVAFVMTYQDEVVGQLTVSDIGGGALRSASIGYWISQHVAGRGITPTAVALAIDVCFGELRLHRVEICIRPENSASLRVVEKLGLRFEGRRARYICIAGEWCDHDSFAITAEEAPRGMLARLERADR